MKRAVSVGTGKVRVVSTRLGGARGECGAIFAAVRTEGASCANDRADGERREIAHQREREQYEGREQVDPRVAAREHRRKASELRDRRERISENDRVREATDEGFEEDSEPREKRGALAEGLGPRVFVCGTRSERGGKR